jgi:hypothetical protein
VGGIMLAVMSGDLPTRRLFDRYIFVDWSASARPARGRDSIWFATGTIDDLAPKNPETREKATVDLRELLIRAAADEERVLIGFDFPYGYPAGFAAALGLDPSSAPWRATWSLLREYMHDGANNANRRFDDAAGLNRLIGSPPGPFWGHPQGFGNDALGWKVRFPFATRGGQRLSELRHTERHLRNIRRTAWPVWKLFGQGAVGSQTLLGIPRVAALRDDQTLAAFSLVWPFETGFTVEAVPDRGPFVLHAEIWPGVLEPDPGSHAVPDARQVLALVEWARSLDQEGHLAREFEAPPSLGSDQVKECIREEGWILGATGAAPRSASATQRLAVGRATPIEGASSDMESLVTHIDALHRAGVISDEERGDLLRRLG